MLKKISDLKQRLQKGKTFKLVVVFAHDNVVIDAISQTESWKCIEPILIGDGPLIEQMCQEYNLKNVQIIDELDPIKATKIAMDLVNSGKADIVMKGLIDTKYLLKGVVNNEYGIKSKKYLTHVGMVEVSGMDRVLFATDGAMMIQPTVEEKIAIIENAVGLAHTLGYEKPLVGIVSSVEKVNPKIASTVDAEAILEHYKNQEISFEIDGPFAVDNLVSMESVMHKGIHSEVAGKADILVFPNLDSGNVFYKTCVFLAHGKSAGIIIGAKVPIIVTSRADNMEAKLNSILLAVVNQDGLLASSH